MLVTEDNLDEVFAFLRQQPILAVDTETTGLQPYQNDHLCGISVAAPPNSYYFPFRHSSENLPADVLPNLMEVLQNTPTLLFWNAPFDLHFLHKDGYEIPEVTLEGACPIEDVSVAAHLADENEKRYGLKFLSRKYLGEDSGKDEEELREWIETNNRSELAAMKKTNPRSRDVWKGLMHRLPAGMVEPYACSDVELTWRMREHYLPILDQWNITETDAHPDLYNEVNWYTLLIMKMEQIGIQLDLDRLDHHLELLEPRMREIQQEIYSLTNGFVSNPNSATQINEWFDRRSTKADDLRFELTGDPLAALLLEYRSGKKYQTSYATVYQQLVDGQGVLHPHYNVIGTQTGRISCSNPNLMAIPRNNEEEGRWVARVKELFVPRPGFVLAEFDLSQAELRIASHYGAMVMLHDRSLSHRVHRGEDGQYLSPMGSILVDPKVDLHQTTADKIGTDRDTAKRINFSAVFGIGPETYCKTYRVKKEDAVRNLAAWHEQFPEFRQLYRSMEQLAMRRGYIQLDSGRVRRYPEDNYQALPRKASSNLVQGTVAEVMRTAQLRVHQYLQQIGGRMLLQVHDSILVELPIGEALDGTLIETRLAKIRHLMTDFGFSPRLHAESKWGFRWSELQKG